MRKFFLIIIVLLMANPVGADSEEENRAADRVTIFNQITDAWAAKGKSENEKREIIYKRKQERRLKRLEQFKNEHAKETKERLGKD